MIRGNERAIDLGLDVLLAVKPGKPVSKTEIAAYIDASREVIGGTRKPFTKQDMFFLESRALRKMQKRSKSKTLLEFAERAGEGDPL